MNLRRNIIVTVLLLLTVGLATFLIRELVSRKDLSAFPDRIDPLRKSSGPIVDPTDRTEEIVGSGPSMRVGHLPSLEDEEGVTQNDLDRDFVRGEEALDLEKSFREVFKRRKGQEERADVQDAFVAGLSLLARRDESVEPLEKILRDDGEEIDVREQAAMALAEIGSKVAVSALRNALQEITLPELRQNLALTIGQITSDESIDVLEDMLIHESEVDIRRVAAEALFHIGTKESAYSLLTFWETIGQNQDLDSQRILFESVHAAVDNGSAIVFQSALLSSNDSMTDDFFRQALGRTGGKDSVYALLEAVDSTDDQELRGRILTAIEVLGDPAVVGVLEEYVTRAQNPETVIRLGKLIDSIYSTTK